MEELNIGDLVEAHWKTRTGKQKQARGVVTMLRGDKVMIRYESTNAKGRSLSWNLRDIWRDRALVTRVTPFKGERAPGEDLDVFVRALAENAQEERARSVVVSLRGRPPLKEKSVVVTSDRRIHRKKQSWFSSIGDR